MDHANYSHGLRHDSFPNLRCRTAWYRTLQESTDFSLIGLTLAELSAGDPIEHENVPRKEEFRLVKGGGHNNLSKTRRIELVLRYLICELQLLICRHTLFKNRIYALNYLPPNEKEAKIYKLDNNYKDAVMVEEDTWHYDWAAISEINSFSKVCAIGFVANEIFTNKDLGIEKLRLAWNRSSLSLSVVLVVSVAEKRRAEVTYKWELWKLDYIYSDSRNKFISFVFAASPEVKAVRIEEAKESTRENSATSAEYTEEEREEQEQEEQESNVENEKRKKGKKYVRTVIEVSSLNFSSKVAEFANNLLKLNTIHALFAKKYDDAIIDALMSFDPKLEPLDESDVMQSTTQEYSNFTPEQAEYYEERKKKLVARSREEMDLEKFEEVFSNVPIRANLRTKQQVTEANYLDSVLPGGAQELKKYQELIRKSYGEYEFENTKSRKKPTRKQGYLSISNESVYSQSRNVSSTSSSASSESEDAAVPQAKISLCKDQKRILDNFSLPADINFTKNNKEGMKILNFLQATLLMYHSKPILQYMKNKNAVNNNNNDAPRTTTLKKSTKRTYLEREQLDRMSKRVEFSRGAHFAISFDTNYQNGKLERIDHECTIPASIIS